VENGSLRVRNRIYRRVFDEKWVAERIRETARAARSSRRENLPVPLTSFVGRGREIAEVGALLASERLVTLVGAGGCGKTRLALQAARERRDDFADGVWFIELAPLTEPELITRAIATELNIREEAALPLVSTLCHALRDRRLLIVLDNCEHLIDAAARVAETLLQHAPGLRILATSREALGVDGEKQYRVPSLTAPAAGEVPLSRQLMQFEAVSLFVERALKARPTFTLTAETAGAVAEICRRLDGIPLALEFAAARLSALSLEQIVARLDDRFQLLTGGSRTALPRHQTLRATLDWSHDLLSEKEQALLRRLSVFAGGWTLEAAEVVCSRQKDPISDLMTHLVDKSLIACEDEGDAIRYRMLETVRQYSQERLREAGEEAEFRRRHRDYYLELAETGGRRVDGPEQGEWSRRLAKEQDNLRAALDWCREEPEGADAELQLAGALHRQWRYWGHLSEGRAHLERALARPGAEKPTAARARALDGIGYLAWAQGDCAVARTALAEAAAIWRGEGNHDKLALSLANLGWATLDTAPKATIQALAGEIMLLIEETDRKEQIARVFLFLGQVAASQGDLAEARRRWETGLTLTRQAGNIRETAWYLIFLEGLSVEERRYDEARLMCEESLASFRMSGDQWGVAVCLERLGELALQRQEYEEARRFYEQAMSRFREQGNRGGLGRVLKWLGDVARREGDAGTARSMFTKSLTIHWELQEHQSVAELLDRLAALHESRGQTERGESLAAGAAALRAAIRARSEAPGPASGRSACEAGRGGVVAADDAPEQAFAVAWAARIPVSLDEFIADVIE
jgi:non-specific serine/threonine protein kinase